MDHVVYVDAKAKELEQLTTGAKRMIIRGATGRKIPYDRVQPGDRLYLINNNAEGLVKAKTQVKHVFQLGKLSAAESVQVIEEYQPKLQLTAAQVKRWAGKRYLVLVEVDPATPVEPFAIDKSAYGNMDDWLPVGDIERVRRAAPLLIP
ncbi:MAG: hypothetical protein DYG89_04875 [Caldilinea sp. CFX5]|nr:hypothetical protein [Caldilinea sp. CFX5]